MTPLPANAERNDSLWTSRCPAKAGTFRWSKDRKWEYVTRVVTQQDDGTLVCWSHKLENYVPVAWVEGRWLIEDLVAQNALPAPKNSCVARRSIFRK